MSASGGAATHQDFELGRPPFDGLPIAKNDVILDLGQANVALILASIGQEANAEEAEQHHGPGRRFRHGAGYRVIAEIDQLDGFEVFGKLRIDLDLVDVLARCP